MAKQEKNTHNKQATVLQVYTTIYNKKFTSFTVAIISFNKLEEKALSPYILRQ